MTHPSVDPWANRLIDKPTEAAILASVGDIVRRARQADGLTLADMAGRLAISPSVLCRIELARRPPHITLLMTACSQLGIRLADVWRAAEDAAVPLPVAPRQGRFHELLS
jgi:ribosome-binding protein aMBF1 (putative translation factor)